MSGRAYVLLSGGIDSTTCLYLAQREFGTAVGLSVHYGQRHRKEIEHARASCRKVGAMHRELDISAVVPRTMLTDPAAPIPSISYSEISGVSPTYVPFRNGLLISAAASFVAGRIDEENRLSDDETRLRQDRPPRPGHQPAPRADQEWGLYFGAHAEDAHNWAYPDCTPEFIGAMANAVYIGTYRQLRLHTPLEWLGKADIIHLGEGLGVDWSLTWSCYAGGDSHCGVCPTCRARRAGFADAGVADPTVYAAVAA